VVEVLTLLGNAGLSLKLKKCHFFSETVDYLGHVIQPGRLNVAEKNTAALKTAPLPPLRRNYDPFWDSVTSTDGLSRASLLSPPPLMHCCARVHRSNWVHCRRRLSKSLHNFETGYWPLRF
jgi:hypothetical protein